MSNKSVTRSHKPSSNTRVHPESNIPLLTIGGRVEPWMRDLGDWLEERHGLRGKYCRNFQVMDHTLPPKPTYSGTQDEITDPDHPEIIKYREGVKRIGISEAQEPHEAVRLIADIRAHVDRTALQYARTTNTEVTKSEADSHYGLFFKSIGEAFLNRKIDTTVELEEEEEKLKTMVQTTRLPDHIQRFNDQYERIKSLGTTLPESRVLKWYLNSLQEHTGLLAEWGRNIQMPGVPTPCRDLADAQFQSKRALETILASKKSEADKKRFLESRRQNNPAPKLEVAALTTDASKGKNSTNNNKKNNKDNNKGDKNGCLHCKRKGKRTWAKHTEAKCWDLHPELKPNAKVDSGKTTTTPRATVGMATTDEEQLDPDIAYQFMCGMCRDEDAALAATTNTTAPYSIHDNRVVTLDTGSTIHLIRDQNMFTKLRKLKTPIVVRGVTGDPSQPARVTHEGDIPHIGPAYWLPTAPANLLSEYKLRSAGRYVYNQSLDQYEITTHNGTWLPFRRSKEKLPVCNLDNDPVSPALAAAGVDLRTRTGKFLTPDHIARARDAQELHLRLDCPSDSTLATMLDSGRILHTALTGHDLANARLLFGPCPHCTISKLVAHPQVSTLPGYPAELGTVVHSDLFYFAKLCFAIFVDESTGYTLVAQLERPSRAQLEIAVKQCLARWSLQEYTIRALHADHENVYGSLQSFLYSKGIELVLSGPGRHNPYAEARIKIVKRIASAILQRIPYPLPASAFPRLIAQATESMNFRPNHRTGSATPRELFTGKKLDGRKMLRYKFGDIVACSVPQNQRARHGTNAETAIYVGRDPVSPDSCRVLLLDHTPGQIVSRTTLQPLVPTPAILESIKRLATSNDDPDKPLLSESFTRLDGTPIADDPLLPEFTPDAATPPSTDATTIPPSEPTVDSVSPHTDPYRGADQPTDALDVPSVNPSVDLDPPNDDPLPPQPAEVAPDAVDLAGEEPTVAIEPAADTIDAATPSADDIARDSTLPPADPPASSTRERPPRRSTTTYHNRYGDQYIHYVKPFLHNNTHKLKDKLLTFDPRSHQPAPDGWHCCLHLTAQRALKTYKNAAKVAGMEEMRQLIDTGAIKPTRPSSLTELQKKHVIRGFTFFKEKYLPNGQFERLKARCVAGSNAQYRDLLGETSAPTVDLASVFTVLNIAAHKDMLLESVDIKGAYLHAEAQKLGDSDDYQVMRLDSGSASMLVAAFPEFSEYLLPDGTMLVELRKSLYGLVESALRWYATLASVLKELDYTCTKADPCVFVKHANGHIIIVCVYVDDLLAATDSKALLDELYAALRQRFGTITTHSGDTIYYLGIEITRNRSTHSIKLTQTGYVHDLLRLYNITTSASTPSTTSLTDTTTPAARYNIDTLPTLLRSLSTHEYISLAMRIMFLAKRTRPDLLFTTTYLATHVQTPEVKHFAALTRLLHYINGTTTYGIHLQPDNLIPVLYCDASFGIHSDAKSHSGYFIALGSRTRGFVQATSQKQKLVTRSSTESELQALYTALPDVIWLRYLLDELGYPLSTPTVAYQDNKSTIIIANATTKLSSKSRSKYFNIRYHYVNDVVKQRVITIEYLPTDQMIADILTKPLTGAIFIALCQALLSLPPS